MPLFNYSCLKCQSVVEKFQHKSTDKIDLVCPNCNSTEFEKVISLHNSRTILNAKDTFAQRIKPDAERIIKNIGKGKDKDFLDMCGDK